MNSLAFVSLENERTAKRLTDPRKRVELRNTYAHSPARFLLAVAGATVTLVHSRYYVVLSESRRRAIVTEDIPRERISYN